MAETQFINYYRCPIDYETWANVWSCHCNDMCPKCGTKDIMPYLSRRVVNRTLKRRMKPRRSRVRW